MSEVHNATTLWVRTGTWWVRADQIAAVGVEEVFHRGGRFSLRIQLSGVACGEEVHELHRFTEETPALACAAAITERVATWRYDHGVLHVDAAGEVVTTELVARSP
ncbi:hypothetical protein JOF53_000828 [Crossiella equi]|uniref:Uncharacterized protein n=1 Tax=Crossiella equi TaxID=130796 RepID=A0ABS5A5X4_9PSEU|nr:hypothetical protein [Crossiella equi]MBP2471956.1 hypothetical protein [Crossiella equi]